MATLADINFGSESESDDGGDFNPQAEIGSDEEIEVQKPSSKSSRPRRSPMGGASDEEQDEEEGGATAHDDDTNGDNRKAGRRDQEEVADDGGEDQGDEDEDEDEDDEDDEEEDAVSGRPRKRVRRDPRIQFLDVEAEVDESDEGDDDDEEDHAGFIAEDHQDDLADLPAGVETDDRGHRELDRKREREQQIDAEEQAKLLKERYGRMRTTATESTLVPKRLLLPSVDDPSIWGVRCKPGKEREVILAILKRIEDRAFSRDPIPIISAFERGGVMSGYVYIETRKQADILPALDGLMNVYPRSKIVLVPIKEMPDLLRVRKTEQLQPGGYVRLKRGKYAGDLAQIDDVESNGLEVTLKIVPRLDYGLNEDVNAPPPMNGSPDGKRKRPVMVNATNRPTQRLFSESDARKKHSRFLNTMSSLGTKKHFTYLNDTYINGYLIKDFKIQHLITENVNPTLEEVTRFTAGAEDGSENLDLTALAASLKKNKSSNNYLPGDTVEVYEGEQQGIVGKATSVRGDIVTLTVIEGELKGQSLEIPTKGLRKRFKEGDHVKVIGGSRFRDEVGMVVRIQQDRVTILSDLSMQEITVFSKDLREASDSGVAGGLGLYDIHDLVQLDPATVGCVTKVDRESLRVLDQNGSIRSIMPSQVSNKIEKRKNAVATDRNGSEIRHDDTVREIGGEGKQGVIMHIHRSFLFLHNREQTENSGIFVVRAANVSTVAAKGGRVTQQSNTGPDLTRMNPALQRTPGTNGSMPPPKSFGRDATLGKTITIRKGPYKGLLGIVKDTTDTEARIELHTKSKTIQLPKDILSIKDPMTGNFVAYPTFASRGRGGGGRGSYGGATPGRSSEWAGSRTPTAAGGGGGRTPAWGALPSRSTPWASGGGSMASARTPRWSQEQSQMGGRTPGWQADGGRTSYGGATSYGGGTGGAGGRTPAWESGNRTAYGQSTATYATGGDAFSGAKTPAYNDSASSRTPAWSGGWASGGASSNTNANPDPWARPHDAPTPAAANAPTPANPYSAPTPAANAPTPKYSNYPMDAPTPAAGAPTPFSGNPETPAAWNGDDDGPRYDESPSP